jgi:hypothetical protein
MISLINLLIFIFIVSIILFIIKKIKFSATYCPKIYLEGKGFDVNDKLCIITGANDGFLLKKYFF